MAVAVAVLSLPVAPDVAEAAGTLTLSEHAPVTVLYGTPSTVTLTATNTSTTTPVYNASFEDVLPAGVRYVPGSSSLTDGATTSAMADPSVLADEPAAGQTTLVWSNVADLQPSSSQVLTFKLQGQTDAGANQGPDPVLPNASYADATSVYVNSNAREVPQFTATTGAPVAGSYTDSATASGTTAVSALAIAKSEPSPEDELPRGVHDHQVTYTITVTNNEVHATDGVTVTDWLPAGLEFLSCGNIDNTTDASGTNPGSTHEYPGSGSLAVGSALSASVCPVPTSVATVDDPVTPQGTLSGVYTEVTWSVPNLAASGVDTIEYKAAIPLRQNTMTWSGAEPSAASGDQAADLDNNNGPETYDGEALTNVAAASGTYQGTANGGASDPTVTASGSATVEAVDLAVQKTVDDPVFSGGTYVSFTLHYETSEYRYATGTVLTDHLPTGLCPIGASDYATDSDSGECAPAGGRLPSTGYTSVAERPDGSFDITWDLGTLPPDTDTTLTFPALDRAFYQGTSSGNLGPTTPTLIGDSVENTTQITGTVNGACYDGSPPSPTADPTCSGTGPTIVYTGTGGQPSNGGESTPTTATNGSQVGQSAAEPTIVKRVSAAVAPGSPLDCSTATYLDGSANPSYPPAYEAGDTICFQLEAEFPAGLYAHDAVVTDFLPPNTAYVAGSARAATGNTVAVPGGAVDAGTSPDSVGFTLGSSMSGDSGLYVLPGQVFLYDLAVTVTAPPSQGNDYDLTANLMKLTALDTAGNGISLRSQVSYDLAQPVVSLAKAVTSVDGGAPTATVEDGNQVGYTVTLTNTGFEPAVDTVVSDTLPSQVASCSASVTAISDGGTCATATQVQWTGITVPAATSAGPGTTTLTYTMTVPTGVAAGEVLSNTAAVTSYQGPPPNNGGTNVPTTYTPGTNAPPASGSASVTLASPTLTKVAAPTVNGPRHATIGEPVQYTLTVTIPAGTTVYDATLDDPLGSHLTYSSTPATSATLQVGSGTPGPVPGGFTLATSGNTVDLTFPTPFSTTAAAADTIVVTFTATVADVAGNAKGDVITNTGTFGWQTLGGAAKSTTASATTTVVEPRLTVAKSDAKSGGPYDAGATVSYAVTASNTGTSAAYDEVVTDTLPAAETSPACVTTPAAWTCTTDTSVSPETITWALRSGQSLAVGAGKAATFTYTAVLPNPAIGSTTFTNNVAATATSLDTTAHPGARTTYAATGADTVHLTGASVAKVASPSSVTNGVDTTYTATITIPAGTNLPDFTAIDTLPDGMTFDAYGVTSTCVDTVTAQPCGSDVVTQSIGTPAKAANGTTTLGWYVGNVVTDSDPRTVTVTYTAYPSEQYHTGTPVTAPATLDNAIGVYWGDTDASGPPSSIPAVGTFTHSSPTTEAPVSVIAPNLTVTKASSTLDPSPGTPFTYTLTLHNSGSSAAYDPTITDTLPSGLDWPATSAGSPSQGTATYTSATGTLVWDLAGTTLAPGGSATLTVQTELGPSGGLSSGETLTNTAIVQHYYGVSSATASGDPGRYETYGPTSSSVPVTPIFPVLAVAKTMPGGSTAVVGTPFAWQLQVSDTTAAPASDVTVTDTLPAYWTYDPGSTTITLASGTAVSAANADPVVTTDSTTHVETLTWPGADLASLGGVDSTHAITLAYSATPQAGVARSNVNAATVDADDASGAPGNASGSYQATGSATAIVPTADLSITKAIGSAGLVAGGGADTYDVAVTNHGPDPAVTPAVVDTAPAGTSFTGGGGGASGWTCALGAAGGTITCTLGGSLASGATAATLVVDIAIPSSDTGSLTNTATVSSPTYDPNRANDTATVTGTITAQADLGITKTHTGGFTAGSTGTYQLVVTDRGPSDSPGVISVVDALPLGESYVSDTGSDAGWTCQGDVPVIGQVTCTLPTGLASGASSAIALTVSVPAGEAPGTLTNTATVSGPLPDSNPADNSASDPTAVTTSADLSIAKTHAPADTFVPGTDVHYTLAIANAGPSDVAAPVVTDTLPGDETFVSASGAGWSCPAPAGTPQVVTCTATSALAAGASATSITLVVQLSPSFTGTSVVNTASASSSTPDPVPGNNSSTDTSASGNASADLSLTKAHVGDFTAGSTGTYTFTVHNAGPSDASGPVTVTDTLPAGETFVSGGGGASGWGACGAAGTAPEVVTCQLAAGLASGGTNTALAIDVQVASSVAPGTLTNTADVSSPTPDPYPGNDTANDPTTIVADDDLAIVKANAASPFVSGDQASYTLDVTNAGPSDAAGPVTVTDDLPAGETFVSGSGTGWTCSATGTPASDVTCTLAAGLGAGTSTAPRHAGLVTLVVAVGSGYVGTSLSNTATVSGPTTDANPADNSSTDVVAAAQQAHLTVSKTHTGSAVAGADLTYQLTVTDTGPSDSSGPLQITDPLPAGEAFVSAGGGTSGWTCTDAGSTVTCSTASGLVAGATSTALPLTVSLDPSVAAGTTLANTATVTTTGTTDPEPGATSTDSATVATAADLSVTKTHTGSLTPGTDASYTLQVANAGPSDAAGPVTVTDPLPAGETFVSATGTGWSCSATGQDVTCTLAAGLIAGTAAAPHPAAPAVLTVAVGAAAYPSVSNTATVASPTPDPVPGNDSSTDVATVVPVADLSITKAHAGSAVAGADLSYSLAVTDRGPTPDPGPVTVTDPLPAGETFVSATGTGWSCSATGQDVTCTRTGPVAVGPVAPITLTVLLGAAAVPSVANTATVRGTADHDPGDDTSTDTATVAPGATLSVTKTLNGSTLVTGSPASYTVTVTDHGPSAASGVRVTDTVPAGLRPTSAAGAGWTCGIAGQVVTCAASADLAAGASSSLVVGTTVVATTGTVANAVTVGAQTQLVSRDGTTASTPPVNVMTSPDAGSGPSSGSGSAAKATATVASTGLAFTGFDAALWSAIGLCLVGVGAGLARLFRKRRAG